MLNKRMILPLEVAGLRIDRALVMLNNVVFLEFR